MEKKSKMDNYEYDPVNNSEDLDQNENKSWIPFLRQMLVCSGALTIYFSIGMCFGAPTIFIQQIRDEANSTDAVSVAMASWLSSAFGYASLPWVFILTAASHVYGRKKTFILVSLNTIIVFICFSLSDTTMHLLVTTIVQGMPHAASFTISILVLSEFTSPEFRGIFLTMKSASVFWGIWCSNAIGAYLHWKYIAYFGLICSSFSLSSFIWPESPYWLASKGKFNECRKAHRWLKGRGKNAEKELHRLTTEQIEIFKIGSLKEISKRQFYMPTLISCLSILQFYASGKFICSIYSIEILKKMTGSKSAAYSGMLILDGATVISMYGGCILNGFVKRRSQLFYTSFVGLIFIFGLSLYLYLIKLNVLVENNILTIAILVLFTVSMSCGPGIMASSTLGEIIPMKYKNLCTIIVSVWFQLLNSTMLKIFPYVYLCFGLHGTFFCCGISMVIVTFILYKLMPETKDKTLQEIEEYFK